MLKWRLIRSSICLATLLSLAYCGSDNSTTPGPSGGAGTGGVTSTGGTTSSGGATASGGATSSGGGTASGGATSSGGATASGGSTSAGGTTSKGGSTSAGGATATGGVTSKGGATSSGGATSGGGATATGGTTSGGGSTSTGGATSTGGTTAATTDCLGQSLAKAGDSTSTSKKYLNLGDIRLIDNRWGADDLNCGSATYKVYVNSDKTLGYDFNRPTCGGDKGKPDYPEIEFGVAPFGTASSLLTSPACSSTTLLPIQLKNLTSASLNIDNFEFWISKNNPATSADGGVFAEIIVFLGWDGIRMTSSKGWPCEKSDAMTSGGTAFKLCHQSDTWSNGQWRFYNFILSNGPQNSFNTKVDIKAFIDWVMKNYTGFTTDMWLTRIELGTEVDDNTSGSAKIDNLTFEINGTSKSVELAP